MYCKPTPEAFALPESRNIVLALNRDPDGHCKERRAVPNASTASDTTSRTKSHTVRHDTQRVETAVWMFDISVACYWALYMSDSMVAMLHNPGASSIWSYVCTEDLQPFALPTTRALRPTAVCQFFVPLFHRLEYHRNACALSWHSTRWVCISEHQAYASPPAATLPPFKCHQKSLDAVPIYVVLRWSRTQASF